MSSRAQLSETISRLLPGESNKRIREAILAAASYSGQRTDQLRQQIDQANRVKTGLLVPGSINITSSTSATLTGYVWAIDFAINQPSTGSTLTITAPHATMQRKDFFIGTSSGTIVYRAGTIDSLGNSIAPSYNPETEVLLVQVLRNASNDQIINQTAGDNWLKSESEGTLNRLAKFIAGYILGDSQILDDGISVMIGTNTSSEGDRLRISKGKLNITNWVTASGAFDRLSLTFGEDRGFGYDPFTNTFFFGGVTKFPWKVDGDAPSDSFVIEDDGSIKMVNLGAGSAGELILFNSDKKLVRNNIIPIETTGAEVKFDKVGGYIHGNAGAITGNITYNFTGEILGSTAFVLHNASTAPTFPSETKIIKGTYVVNTDNYIWFCITKIGTGRIVQVTISQL